MAVGKVEIAIKPDTVGRLSYPVSIQSDWVASCTAPDANDAPAIVASKAVKPGAIVREEQNLIQIDCRATSLMVALKYDPGISGETAPVVRVFGRDTNKVWHLLRDKDANVELTLVIDKTTDVFNDAATFQYTFPVEVDLDGSAEVMVVIQTAFNVSGGDKTNSEIVVKPK